MTRWFLAGGGMLAVIGILLWFALRIPSTFPPFLATALLALAYGAACLKRNGRPDDGKS